MNPWTDEDEDLLIRALWARANGRRLRADEPSPERGTMFGFQARAVLQALAAANRLVPPGSEVREEWGVWHQPPGRGVTFCVLSPDADCDDEEAWAREHAAAEPGSHVECRLHIVTPWSPSVPDTEEGS